VQISIRDAEESDLPAVLTLMRALADHEGLARYFQLTQDALLECCLRNPKRFDLLVAVSETAVIGYATYMFQFSPWAVREYLFLDDIYVAEEARKGGVGSRLMQRVAEIALEHDVDVRWHVEPTNESAFKLYIGLAAELRAKFIAYWSREAMRLLLDSKRVD